MQINVNKRGFSHIKNISLLGVLQMFQQWKLTLIFIDNLSTSLRNSFVHQENIIASTQKQMKLI